MSNFLEFKSEEFINVVNDFKSKGVSLLVEETTNEKLLNANYHPSINNEVMLNIVLDSFKFIKLDFQEDDEFTKTTFVNCLEYSNDINIYTFSLAIKPLNLKLKVNKINFNNDTAVLKYLLSIISLIKTKDENDEDIQINIFDKISEEDRIDVIKRFEGVLDINILGNSLLVSKKWDSLNSIIDFVELIFVATKIRLLSNLQIYIRRSIINSNNDHVESEEEALESNIIDASKDFYENVILHEDCGDSSCPASASYRKIFPIEPIVNLSSKKLH